MENERQPLVKSLLETFQFYKTQKRVGRMKTEHSIFVPAALMVNSEKETADFVKAAKHISKQADWKCPVSLEQHNSGKVMGVEFVFEFSPETKFDSVIDFLTNY